MYVPHLLCSFICLQTFRLLPCLGYCEQCCYDHRGSCIFLDYSFILGVFPGMGLLDHIVILLEFSEQTAYCFSWQLHQLTFPPAVSEWNPGLLVLSSVPFCHSMFFSLLSQSKNSLFFNSPICCDSVEIAHILYKNQMPHEQFSKQDRLYSVICYVYRQQTCFPPQEFFFKG